MSKEKSEYNHTGRNYRTDQTDKKGSNAGNFKKALNLKIMDKMNLPDTLEMSELMEVKGGILDESQVCILAAAVKCTVQGSGVIVQVPEQPKQP